MTSGAVSADVLAQLRSGKLLVRQRPGPANSLGLVKFMFPNEHNVYLHSTPATVPVFPIAARFQPRMHTRGESRRSLLPGYCETSPSGLWTR